MNKGKLNYWIDIGLAISFFVCFFTGLGLWPGLIKILGTSTYRIIHTSNIATLHAFSGLVMGLLVLVHLILHWNWIISMTKSIFKKK